MDSNEQRTIEAWAVFKHCAAIVRLHSCRKVYAKLNLLMAQMLVLNDTSVLYHLNHVKLGAGAASNLTETVH
jgi:hypothetical protein